MSPSRKIVATIEARMASTRLPAKVMALILGRPLLELLIERVAAASSVDQIVVATTVNPADDEIEALAARLGVGCHRGSVDDVVGRVLGAAEAFGADDIVALTGDNPLVDPQLIDDVVEFYRAGGFDYVTTTHMHHSLNWKAERTFPVGVSVQVFSRHALADAAGSDDDPAVREHTAFAIYDHPERYRLGAFEAAGPYASWRRPDLRMTVDTAEDLAVIREIFETLGGRDIRFSTGEAIRLLAETPRLRALNGHVRQRIVSERRASRG